MSKKDRRQRPSKATALANTQTGIIPIRAIAAQVMGLNEKEPGFFINLKYYHSGFECFSEWQRAELKQFSSLTATLQQLNLLQLRTHSGLRMKAPKGKLAAPVPISLQPHLKHIEFVELRLSDKIRVHGFIEHPYFFLVWLDRNHRVFPD